MTMRTNTTEVSTGCPTPAEYIIVLVVDLLHGVTDSGPTLVQFGSRYRDCSITGTTMHWTVDGPLSVMLAQH